ncbi:hypothetical protein SY27_11305 [Flavobacterium sp. 316]|uniref:glycosyltransferase family 39 protein n=1 Tax=Flavobacterium sp. 316 TaxID=1603293 RepID=UPI0005E43DFF|nr:glycosyltransferase family 39 protein [Flavobacterium sp. 316]KIX20497.1 hypothetical protein SY27_11305 [Flavobacterium sp. 316]
MKKYKDIFIKNKWLVIILIIASILRLYKLDFQSLWMDEIYTLNVASSNHSFTKIISEVNLRESFPYMYFFIMNTMFTIFGNTDIVARFPSAIFGIAAVFMMYKLGKEAYSKNVGLISALLFTFNEYAIYHSQEARAYSMYLFFLLFSYYRLIKYLKKDTRKNLIWYAVSAGLLLNSNFFSVINVIAQGVVLLFLFFTIEKQERIQFFKKIFIIISIIFLFFLPNAYKFYLLSQFNSSWIPAPSDEGLTGILKEFLSTSEILLFIYSFLFTYFMIIVFSDKKTKNIKNMRTNKLVFNYWIVFSWISFVLITIVMKSYLSSSLYVSRYFISVIPAIILIISISLDKIKNQQIKISFFFLLLFFMLFNLVVVKKYYNNPSKTQFREASQLIIKNNKTKETVYTSLKYWFDYYLNEKDFNLVEKTDLETLINEMKLDSTKVKPFWYIDAHGRPFNLTEESQRFINDNFYIENNFDGLDAWSKHFILLKDVKKDVDISSFGELKDYNGSPFMFNIEVFETTDELIKVSGWAYFDKQSSEKSIIKLVLIKEGKATIIPSQKVSRPDVTSYFESLFDLSYSGFQSNFDIKNLPKGEYKLGILIENKATNKRGLNLTSKSIIK